MVTIFALEVHLFPPNSVNRFAIVGSKIVLVWDSVNLFKPALRWQSHTGIFPAELTVLL